MLLPPSINPFCSLKSDATARKHPTIDALGMLRETMRPIHVVLGPDETANLVAIRHPTGL